MGGGVAALAVVFPDGGDGHELFARQSIDQTGLAHAGGAQEDHRLSWLKVGVQPVQALARMGTDHMDIHTGGHPLHLGQVVPVVLHQVRLGQQDHGGGPGLPAQGQIPLQPLRVKVQIQRLHDEHIVKIRRHRLISGDGAGLPAGEEGPAGQGGGDLAVAVFDVVDHDEITGGGEILGVDKIFFGFQPGMGQALGADDFVAFLVDGGDPRGDAGQIFGIRHKAVIVNIQCLFLPNQ